MIVTPVIVTPDAVFAMYLVYFGTVHGRVEVKKFGNWHGHLWRGEERQPSAEEIEAAATLAAGRTLKLEDWEVRSNGILTFRFEPAGEPVPDSATWFNKEVAGLRKELQLDAEPTQGVSREKPPASKTEAEAALAGAKQALTEARREVKQRQAAVRQAEQDLARFLSTLPAPDDCPLFRNLPTPGE